MAISHLLLPTVSNLSNFHCLALFICHLFSDGQFRTVHFLYDPNVFDHNILMGFNTQCPDSIPFYLTNIGQKILLPWNTEDNLDNVLQIIFFDSEWSATKMRAFEGLFAYYRIFAFPSAKNISATDSAKFFKTRKSLSDSRELLLHYNSSNDSILVESDSNEQPKRIFTMNRDTLHEQSNLFDETFGEYERREVVAVNQEGFYDSQIGDFRKFPIANDYVLNYFQLKFNQSFINMTWTPKSNSPHLPWKNQKVMLHPRPYYKEVCLDFDSIESEFQPNENYLFSFHVHAATFLSAFGSYPLEKVNFLYPYHTVKFVAVFVYGTDYKRGMDTILIPKSIQFGAGLIVLFILMCAIVLFIVRRKLKLPNADFASAFLDCWIPFIGGGTLRMPNRLERCFFAILLFGAFFIVNVFVGDLLESALRVLNHKISKFEELAAINPPIYNSADNSMYYNRIRDELRSKIGPNVDYRGIADLKKLIKLETSFVLIVEDVYVYELLSHRDYDQIEEPLGEFHALYILYGKNYANRRMNRKFNTILNSMLTNGLYQFYKSHSKFKRSLRRTMDLRTYEHDDRDLNDLQPLNMAQFIRPIVLIFGLWITSILVFIAEFFVYKLRERRSRRVMPFLPVTMKNRRTIKRVRVRGQRVKIRQLAVRAHTAPF